MSEIQIILTGSLAGAKNRVKATAKSIGLSKVGSTTTQPDNGATKGKIRQLAHIVSTKVV